MMLEVPYHSQYLEIPDHDWNIRSCGAACLKMVLDFKNVAAPELYEFVKEGSNIGAYGQNGWIHDKLLEMAANYGVEMYRKEKMDFEEGKTEIVESLKAGKPVIISTLKSCLGQTKFHMVILVGFEQNDKGEVSGFYFHEPESTSVEKGKNLFVSLDDFEKSWRRMALFLK